MRSMRASLRVFSIIKHKPARRKCSHPSAEAKQNAPQARLAARLCMVWRLVLGDDGAVGASVAARTAVQASGSIDDISIIALADGTGGAGIRASAAADTGRSNFVSHGKHLHKNL